MSLLLSLSLSLSLPFYLMNFVSVFKSVRLSVLVSLSSLISCWCENDHLLKTILYMFFILSERDKYWNYKQISFYVRQRTSIRSCVRWSVGWSLTNLFDDTHGARIGLLGLVIHFSKFLLNYVLTTLNIDIQTVDTMQGGGWWNFFSLLPYFL